LSAFLENRAGRLALLRSILTEAGVELRALSVTDAIEHGLARCVVDDPGTARRAIESKGTGSAACEPPCSRRIRPGARMHSRRFRSGWLRRERTFSASTGVIPLPAKRGSLLPRLDPDAAEEALADL
jgi:hypothetical protein